MQFVFCSRCGKAGYGWWCALGVELVRSVSKVLFRSLRYHSRGVALVRRGRSVVVACSAILDVSFGRVPAPS